MICDVSALEAVRELAASALLAVVFAENDAGKPQGGFVGGEVHLTPADDLVRVHSGQSLDKRLVHQLRLIGLDKQRHAGEDGRFEGVGCPMPCPGNQTQHTGEGRAAQEPVGVDNGAGGGNFKGFSGGPVQRPGKAGVLYPLLHLIYGYFGVIYQWIKYGFDETPEQVQKHISDTFSAGLVQQADNQTAR